MEIRKEKWLEITFYNGQNKKDFGDSKLICINNINEINATLLL